MTEIVDALLRTRHEFMRLGHKAPTVIEVDRDTGLALMAELEGYVVPLGDEARPGPAIMYVPGLPKFTAETDADAPIEWPPMRRINLPYRTAQHTDDGHTDYIQVEVAGMKVRWPAQAVAVPSRRGDDGKTETVWS